MSDKIKSVITCDLDGKIETLSEGAQKLFGYSEDEMVGKGRVSDFSPGQIVLGHVVNWLNESVEKGAWEGDTVFLHKDGHEIPCHIKITPTKDKEGEHCFESFLNDDRFYFPTNDLTYDITKASYPKEPYVSFLDHILVTSSFIDKNSYQVDTIPMDEYMGGFDIYESYISDHMPVYLSFPVDSD